jgi:uncharacterized protein YndB with AHSA1/START domain
MLIHTRISGHVDVPPEQVWGFLGDISRLPIWHFTVASAREIDGTFTQQGSTALLALKSGGAIHDYQIQVTEVQPLRKIVHVGTEVDGPLHYTTTVTFVPAGPGTDWVWEQDTEMQEDLPAPFNDPAFATRYLERTFTASTELLKFLLEALVPQAV